MSYAHAPVPVREDLTAAHANFWNRLAQPGTWWTGAEKVAIAREVRNAARCALCRERKAALSPYTVAGEHEGNGVLGAVTVDAIHRITTDPGRLTRQWFDRTRAAGLDEGQYVELLGVLTTVFCIDSFCRGLGVPPHPLPVPVAGEPTRYRPAGLRVGGAWVKMIAQSKTAPPEADLWREMKGRPVANVVRALSLVPDEVRTLKEQAAAHYITPTEMLRFGRYRSLERTQIELIAGRVSALRGCFY